MNNNLAFEIKAKVWQYPGKGGWFFVTIKGKPSKELKKINKSHRRGWGAIPVIVSIGKTKFSTSVFPDKKSDGYLLPLKKEVRIKENIEIGTTLNISIVLDILDI